MAVASRTELHERYDAAVGSIRPGRDAIVRFAADAGVDQARLPDVGLAASEALTNVVKHAYGSGGGTIEVEAFAAGGEVCVLIADSGRGLRPHQPGDGLGLGLMLIVSLCDELAIAKRSGGGTELSMRFRVARDAGRARRTGRGVQSRGSVASATSPAA
jgi:serine/threonine-protein kinase RsbW